MTTLDLLPAMPDDFAVTCEEPEKAAEAVLALVALKARIEESATASLLPRRRRRSVVLGGTRLQRARNFLCARPDPDSAWVVLAGEDVHAAWEHLGIQWRMRIAMPERFPVPDRRSTVEIVRRLVDLAIVVTTRIGDPREIARGAALVERLRETARSAAAQLHEPGIVACPAPIGMLGPEINHRALSGDEHTHVASNVLMERLSRTMPPCVNAWLNYTERERFGHVWQDRHIGLYGDFALGYPPRDTMERLRALAQIPDGETWSVEP